MTGRKGTRAAKKRVSTGKQTQPAAAAAQQQSQSSTASTASQQPPQQQQQPPDDLGSPSAANIRKEQPPPAQIVKKILKVDNDESRTLKNVFKSNPDSQMKEFIKKAATKPTQQAAKATSRTPADSHPPAIAQELLETDDDVADNLARLFKASKSYKNV